jgi:hypothetical protein
MVCTLTVDWSNTFGQMYNNKLEHIRVEGTANGCTDVYVTLYYIPPAPDQPKTLGPVKATMSSPINWICIFQWPLPATVVCGKGQFCVEAKSNGDTNKDREELHDFNCKNEIIQPPPPPKNPVTFTTGKDSECNCPPGTINDMRLVEVEAHVDYSPNKAKAYLQDSNNKILDPGPPNAISIPFDLKGSGCYKGGTTEEFYCIFTDPPNMPKYSTKHFIKPCPVQPPIDEKCTCIHSYNVEYGVCNKDMATVPVTVTATAELTADCDPNMTLTAELRCEMNSVLDGPKTGKSVQLIWGPTDYPEGSHQIFYLCITDPPKCANKENTKIDVNVPKCGKEKPPEEGPPAGQGTGGSGCGKMLWIVGILLSLGAAITAIVITGSSCGGPPPVWLLYFVVGLDIAAALAVALWYILCHTLPGCNCPTGCDWLKIGTMTTFAAFDVVSWIILCCPLVKWVAGGFFAAFLGAFVAWTVRCKPSECEIYDTLEVALVSGAVPAISYLALVPQLAACGSGILVAINGTLAVAIVALQKTRCKRSP